MNEHKHHDPACPAPSPRLPEAPARERAQLRATKVNVTLGGRTLLTDLDLAVSHRTRLAVVGENGRGKTTLLHVLAGLLVPDGGRVQRTGTIALAEQELEVHAGLSVGNVLDDAWRVPHAALADLTGPLLGSPPVLRARTRSMPMPSRGQRHGTRGTPTVAWPSRCTPSTRARTWTACSRHCRSDRGIASV